jgi:hypothetical protein
MDRWVDWLVDGVYVDVDVDVNVDVDVDILKPTHVRSFIDTKR